jgi:MinD-like ATPase involved in chromosome partitioning or flagellar assembly
MRFAATALERTRTTVDPSRVLVAVAPRGSRATGTVVAGVALAMAEGGHRVLVVGADPTDTTVTDVLDPGGPSPGLAEVVAGTATPAEAARPVRGNAHVAVMGAGAQCAGRQAGEPYRRAVAGALGELAADYDVVLVAAPGLLDTAVSGELVEAADATVLVLGRREPARDHLAVAQRLELSGATVLGYVFLPVAPPRIAVDSTPQSADGPAEHEVVDGGVEEIPVTPLGPVPAINGQQTPVSAMNGSRPTPFPRDRD